MYHIQVGPTAFEHTIIDGHPALVRGYCWRVDAVVDLGDEILVMNLHGGQVGPRGGRWTFDWFAERLEIGIRPARADAEAPPASDQPSPTATPEPGLPWTEPFISERYGYSIRYPSGWTVVAAPGPDEPDRILAPKPSTSVLSITRLAKPEGKPLLDFGEQDLRHRALSEGCRWNGSSTSKAVAPELDSIHVVEVDDHWGAYRSECTYVDAIVQDGDEFLAITLNSPASNATGDQFTFDRFVETVEFTDGQTPETWTLFTSRVHGYSIRYPPDWHATHSTEDRLPDVLDDSVRQDAFGSRLSIRRLAPPPGESIADVRRVWIKQARLKAHQCGGRLPTGGVVPRITAHIPEEPEWVPYNGADRPRVTAYEQATIAGRPALIRSGCGVVDAIVDVDGDALLLVLQSSSMVAGPKRLFVDLSQSLEIDDRPQRGQSGNASGPRSASSEASFAWSSEGSHVKG